ncbi:helix-turn-helix domain-containing protein [Serinicoccus kebangsaanensis]|uniref:helix-turn-helix domain-containing protein n=1 Tax=Serinicoccus kebangsaanensis TaxID=2602069 RepID=UPI00124F0A16|nr:helix-turn-helix domain-containing protein [Serinicoccus kebangsaanensis]
MNGNSPPLDLLAHPVRLRLLSELAGRTATTKQLAESLHDVPSATLYRHVSALLDAGVLEVADGSTERDRLLRIAAGMDRLEPDALRDASVSEHRGFFATYVASLMDTFAAALDESTVPELLDAGLSYNRVVVHLTDAERGQMRSRLEELVGEMLQQGPRAGTRPYTLASVVVPRPDRGQA